MKAHYWYSFVACVCAVSWGYHVSEGDPVRASLLVLYVAASVWAANDELPKRPR